MPTPTPRLVPVTIATFPSSAPAMARRPPNAWRGSVSGSSADECRPGRASQT